MVSNWYSSYESYKIKRFVFFDATAFFKVLYSTASSFLPLSLKESTKLFGTCSPSKLLHLFQSVWSSMFLRFAVKMGKLSTLTNYLFSLTGPFEVFLQKNAIFGKSYLTVFSLLKDSNLLNSQMSKSHQIGHSDVAWGDGNFHNKTAQVS